MIKIDKIAETLPVLSKSVSKTSLDASLQTIAGGEEKLLAALDALACQKAADVIKPADNTTLLKTLKSVMNSYLSSHKYKMGNEGRFFKDFEALDASDLTKIGKKHTLSDFIKFHICGDVTAEDILEIANMNEGKYLSYWNKNPDELIMLTSRIKSPSSFQEGFAETDFLGKAKKNPAIWDMAMDSFINTADERELLALMGYKSGGYSGINQGLIDGNISEEFKDKTETITNLIDKYTINSPVTVFRGEGPGILMHTMTNNGEVNLAEILSKAIEEGNTEVVASKILQLNPEVIQKGFMSTSFSDRFLYQTINWELNVAPGTKGVFLETLPMGSDGKELEVLLQNGSKIRIKDIKFKQGKIPQWFLKGEVSN